MVESGQGAISPAVPGYVARAAMKPSRLPSAPAVTTAAPPGAPAGQQVHSGPATPSTGMASPVNTAQSSSAVNVAPLGAATSGAGGPPEPTMEREASAGSTSTTTSLLPSPIAAGVASDGRFKPRPFADGHSASTPGPAAVAVALVACKHPPAPSGPAPVPALNLADFHTQQRRHGSPPGSGGKKARATGSAAVADVPTPPHSGGWQQPRMKSAGARCGPAPTSTPPSYANRQQVANAFKPGGYLHRMASSPVAPNPKPPQNTRTPPGTGLRAFSHHTPTSHAAVAPSPASILASHGPKKPGQLGRVEQQPRHSTAGAGPQEKGKNFSGGGAASMVVAADAAESPPSGVRRSIIRLPRGSDSGAGAAPDAVRKSVEVPRQLLKGLAATAAELGTTYQAGDTRASLLRRSASVDKRRRTAAVVVPRSAPTSAAATPTAVKPPASSSSNSSEHPRPGSAARPRAAGGAVRPRSATLSPPKRRQTGAATAAAAPTAGTAVPAAVPTSTAPQPPVIRSAVGALSSIPERAHGKERPAHGIHPHPVPSAAAPASAPHPQPPSSTAAASVTKPITAPALTPPPRLNLATLAAAKQAASTPGEDFTLPDAAGSDRVSLSSTPAAPAVPKLNLTPLIAQQEAEQGPVAGFAVPTEAPAGLPAAATPPQHSHGRSGERGAGKKAPPPAPPPDHFYFYPKLDPEMERRTLESLSRMPKAEQKFWRSIFNDSIQAKQNCEAIAFRGHRLLDQMNSHHKERMEEKERQVGEEMGRYQAAYAAAQAEMERLRAALAEERARQMALLQHGLAGLAPGATMAGAGAGAAAYTTQQPGGEGGLDGGSSLVTQQLQARQAQLETQMQVLSRSMRQVMGGGAHSLALLRGSAGGMLSPLREGGDGGGSSDRQDVAGGGLGGGLLDQMKQDLGRGDGPPTGLVAAVRRGENDVLPQLDTSGG